MWTGYEGKYFQGRDFYEWGIDYELQKIIQKFDNNIDTLDLYSSSIMNTNDIPININQFNKKEQEVIEQILKYFSDKEIEEMYNMCEYKELLDKYPKLKEFMNNIDEDEADTSFRFIIIFCNIKANFKNIHLKMVLIHLCTIIDEILSEIIKAIGMYYSIAIKDINIKISLKEIEEIKNKTDLKEYFLDKALRHEKSLSGIIEKIKFIMKRYCEDNKYDYSNIKKMKFQRDCIIHRNSTYDKKTAQDLDEKYLENEQISLTQEDIKIYIEDSKKLIYFLQEKIEDYYIIKN